ncbi:DUF805 domain-containing protein [uncultured Methylibium sp.]|uniref:DUF805 domain-containing protein n=1 Tax=uncultured Methylibium sp. TaxID=381093 RepID=UPI0025FC4016|nr:DUF805 domain-containing protein [uncultured Methylibium sp.]
MPIVREFLPLGRLSRLGFWWRHLLVLPLLLALCIAAARTPGAPWDLLAAAATTLFLVSVWGRRLHDRDRSAWWLLLAAVPLLGALWLLIDCALLGSRRERRAIDYRTV